MGKNYTGGDFPGGSVVRFLTPNAGDTGSVPTPGTEILHAAAGGGNHRGRKVTTDKG